MMATKRRWMKIPRTRLSETCPALMTQRSFKVHVAMWQVQVRGQGRRFTLAHSHWSGQLYVVSYGWPSGSECMEPKPGSTWCLQPLHTKWFTSWYRQSVFQGATAVRTGAIGAGPLCPGVRQCSICSSPCACLPIAISYVLACYYLPFYHIQARI